MKLGVRICIIINQFDKIEVKNKLIKITSLASLLLVYFLKIMLFKFKKGI